MQKVLFLPILGLLLFTAPSGELGANPFLNQPSQGAETATPEDVPPQGVVSPETNRPGFRPLAWLLPLQRRLQSTLSSLVRSIQEDGSFWSWSLLLLTAFAYGVLHAAGPGHGKTVMTAWMLSGPWKIRHALVAGNLTALFHASSALLVVVLPYYVISGVFRTNHQILTRIIEGVSAFMIMILGLYLLISLIREIFFHHHHQHGRPQGGPVALAFVSGIVPCPGAALILIFGISLGALVPAILAVAAMGLGMGLTISATGVLVYGLKNRAQRVAQGHGETKVLWTRLAQLVRFLGSLVILFMGLVLFAGSW